MHEFLPTDWLRPGFHVTPRRNWMNDPNGLVVVDGTYHAYFQHNPEGNQWGHISWGHVTSTDLIRWTEHPVALRDDEGEMVFSGSIVIDADNTSGFGSVDGGDGGQPLVAIYTSVAAADGNQAQALAYSLDGGYQWTKYGGNPVLDRSSTDFRDPKVTRYEGADETFWLMTVVEAVERTVLFYRSANLRDWEYLSSFDEPVGWFGDGARSGCEGADSVWECPDLVLVPSSDGSPPRWALIISVNPGAPNGGSATMYLLGDFDGRTFTPTDARPLWLDYGTDYYAAVSFAGLPRDRVLTMAWMSNWRYAARIPTHPWRGGLTLPRELSVRAGHGDETGPYTLCQHVPSELAAQFEPVEPGRPVPATLTNREFFESPGRFRLHLDLDLSGCAAVEFGFFVAPSDDAEPIVVMRYDRDVAVLRLDRLAIGASDAPADLETDFVTSVSAHVPIDAGRLELIVWVDSASIEVQTSDGTTWMTMLVLPEPGSTAWSLQPVGGDVSVTRLELAAAPAAESALLL